MASYYTCPACGRALKVITSTEKTVTGECYDCGVQEVETGSIFTDHPGQMTLFGG